MSRFRIPILTCALALSACAGTTTLEAAAPRPQGRFAPALLTPAAAPVPVKIAARATRPAPAARLRLTAPAASRDDAKGLPVARVEAANRAAIREPSGEGYVNAVQVYPWANGALYRLYTAPGRVSEIALEPGEALISVAAGDTARWVIGDTASGTGATRRTHVLVKPTAVGLATNLVIATDRRVYHVQLESTAGTAMASISWTYPQDALLALGRARGAAPPPPVATGLDLAALDFGYAIEGDEPPWRPLRAFDDGNQVFIEFPESLARGEAPPLFVSGGDHRAELVNYRVRGRFYVVDRLFAEAELRLGERRQQIVRIIRKDRHRSRRRGKSS